MALSNYGGSVELISGLKPKNNLDFPLMEAHAVQIGEDGTRLDVKIQEHDGILEAYNERINALEEGGGGTAEDEGNYSYVSMMPYLEANDTTNINLLLQNGKKFHFNGTYREAEVGDTMGYDNPSVTAFALINFDWEWTPDTTPSFDGNNYTGAVSNFTATLDYDGYTLVSASATRMTLSCNSNEYGEDIALEVNCSLDLSVIIKESGGTEYTCTYGLIWWGWLVNAALPTDGCMNYIESYIKNTDAPTTYDLRTQSIDRQLAAALEAAIAKRRAEQTN